MRVMAEEGRKCIILASPLNVCPVERKCRFPFFTFRVVCETIALARTAKRAFARAFARVFASRNGECRSPMQA